MSLLQTASSSSAAAARCTFLPVGVGHVGRGATVFHSTMRRYSRDQTAAAAALACLAMVGLADSARVDVCFEGYVMDTFCIERGTLLDNPSVATLENPGAHSVHCLVDVQQCYSSGFELLLDPPSTNGTASAGSASTFCRALKLDKEGNSRMLELARSTGLCSTCSGPADGPRYGFRATVKGSIDTEATVQPPILATTSVEPSSAGCGAAGPWAPTGDNCRSDAGSDAPLVEAHGSLMVVSWGLLLPSGAVVSRCLRHKLRDPLWFQVHRVLQVCGVLAGTAGFLIAVSSFAVFSKGYFIAAQIHGSLGIIVMVLGFTQPINACFRPHKAKEGEAVSEDAARRRAMWERLHKGVGWLTVVMAVPTILLGTLLAGKGRNVAFLATYCVFLTIVISLAVFGCTSRPAAEPGAQEKNKSEA